MSPTRTLHHDIRSRIVARAHLTVDEPVPGILLPSAPTSKRGQGTVVSTAVRWNTTDQKEDTLTHRCRDTQTQHCCAAETSCEIHRRKTAVFTEAPSALSASYACDADDADHASVTQQ